MPAGVARLAQLIPPARVDLVDKVLVGVGRRDMSVTLDWPPINLVHSSPTGSSGCTLERCACGGRTARWSCDPLPGQARLRPPLLPAHPARGVRRRVEDPGGVGQGGRPHGAGGGRHLAVAAPQPAGTTQQGPWQAPPKPLPMSKRQVDLLGERLATSETIPDDDLVLLEGVLDVYDNEALPVVERRLLDLGFAPTTRVKTTGTLIDKLRREQGMKLSRVQDVAGARIVVDGSRRNQDEAVALIVSSFDAREPKDRRANPSSGYRAVHVTVLESGLPVEIQVRTPLQDSWAQLFERLADRWGRGIRYGQEPDEPDTIVPETFVSGRPGTNTRREALAMLLETSEDIDEFEKQQIQLQEAEEELAEVVRIAARGAEEATKTALEVARKSVAVVNAEIDAKARSLAGRLLTIVEQLQGEGK
jgi:ppGpp synthetase/RelA/SpoT-type nucleotidyltranferase